MCEREREKEHYVPVSGEVFTCENCGTASEAVALCLIRGSHSHTISAGLPLQSPKTSPGKDPRMYTPG